MPIDPDMLYGTWRLLSHTGLTADGAQTELYGSAPRGVLNYGRDGRMFAMIVHGERPNVASASQPTERERAALFDTVAAYAGTFTVEGDRVIHHVDLSWNGSWTGTDQVRTVRLEGRTLSITAIDAGVIYTVVWERFG